jgi:hypothetical protein
MINEINNRNLYFNLDDCLEYCKSIKDIEYNDFTYYHIYWNVGLEFGRKQLISIKSYLSTQNLENTKLILWSNIDLTNNELLKPYLPYIEFRIYDPIEEARGTVLEGKLDILTANDNRNWAGGDLFRVLILNNYGGVYVDVDVVFLRDFAPLLKYEFMYKWGLEPNMINGAIMRMFKNSKLCNNILSEISNGGISVNTVHWSSILYEKVRSYNKEWVIFPSGFFNSEWQDMRYNTPGNGEVFLPFKKDTFSLYDGAFSWHWHNKWDANIEDGSKWKTLEDKAELILKEKIKL